MRVVCIIQARLNSSRLPNKILLPLAGKSLLRNLYERVSRAHRIDETVIAVPRKDLADIRWETSDRGDDLPVHAFSRCPENDLVARHLKAAEQFQADIIVRIPGDNPCVEPGYIDKAVDRYMAHPYTFYSNTTDYAGKWVDGIGAEVFSISTLKWLDQKTQGIKNLREHPHQFFQFPLHAADVRLDVNTFDDYRFIEDIYAHFGHNTFRTSEVLDYLAIQRNVSDPDDIEKAWAQLG